MFVSDFFAASQKKMIYTVVSNMLYATPAIKGGFFDKQVLCREIMWKQISEDY